MHSDERRRAPSAVRARRPAAVLVVGFLAAAAVAACGCPREYVPLPSGDDTTVLGCGRKPNCGQCLSDQRCAFCVQSGHAACIPAGASCSGARTDRDPNGAFCAQYAASDARAGARRLASASSSGGGG